MSMRGSLITAADYCTTYHCAGDCGQPHDQAERIQQFTLRGRRQERTRLTLKRTQIGSPVDLSQGIPQTIIQRVKEIES